MFSECTTHYTDPTRSVSAFSVMFITGMSTAAVSQLFSTNVSSVYSFPLVNLTKVSTAAHSMYFPSFFQLGSPLILVTAPEFVSSFITLLFPYSYCQRRVLGSKSLLVVYVFNFYQTLRVVPHGTKGTGPGFVTRPAYLRSQFRNNTNTVSTLVLLVHLLQIHYRFFVHGTWVSHITGCSRPPGEVGLTPRRYTEWNVVGRARSTGGPSQ